MPSGRLLLNLAVPGLTPQKLPGDWDHYHHHRRNLRRRMQLPQYPTSKLSGGISPRTSCERSSKPLLVGARFGCRMNQNPVLIANHDLPFACGDLPGDQHVVAIRSSCPAGDVNVIACGQTLRGAARIWTEVRGDRAVRALDHHLCSAVLRRHLLNRSADSGFCLGGRAIRPWMRLRRRNSCRVLRLG